MCGVLLTNYFTRLHSIVGEGEQSEHGGQLSWRKVHPSLCVAPEGPHRPVIDDRPLHKHKPEKPPERRFGAFEWQCTLDDVWHDRIELRVERDVTIGLVGRVIGVPLTP